jgi:excisionase family DNA binding protein
VNEQLITVSELAEELRVPRSFIYSRTRQTGPDAIPMIRVGKYCRFRLGDVLAWLERKSEESDNN